jgi:hypothetical protein
MGASADEIDRQINETRDHIDQNLGVLEKRAASNAMRYGRIAAVVLGVVIVAGAGVLIYRRMNARRAESSSKACCSRPLGICPARCATFRMR